MTELNGIWRVRRTGGLLPPLVGVRKRISGDRGVTRVSRLPGVPFRVEGSALHYEWPFSGFVDEVAPGREGYEGRATFRGREFGRFRMTRDD